MQSQKRAKFSSEMEEFVEEFIPVLQCFSCKAVPGPEEAKRKRYNCFNESHALCENCKFRCPCGSQVCRKPSKLAEKVLNKYPWMCCNFNEGCRESRSQVEMLEIHQRNCDFRKVHCPVVFCNEMHKFMHLIEHLQSHENPVMGSPVEITGEKEFAVKLTDDPTKESDYGWLRPIWLQSQLGTFFLNRCVKRGFFYLWVSYYGSPEGAKNLRYTIRMKGDEDEYASTFHGTVLTVDEEEKYSIIENKPIMTIKLGLAQQMQNKKKRLMIKLKITSLKEEAKDEDVESGVSDVSY